MDYVLYSGNSPKVALSIKTAIKARSKTFKAIAVTCASQNLSYVVLDDKKDIQEDKIVQKINEALFSDIFAKYVLFEEGAGVSEHKVEKNCGNGYLVKVKFADNRAYEYACFDETQIGDVVYVSGSKKGCRGMIVAILSTIHREAEVDSASSVLQVVETILRIEK